MSETSEPNASQVAKTGILEASAPSKERKLYPQKLIPPLDVIKRMQELEKLKMPKNKYLRFFKIFFGEGF